MSGTVTGALVQAGTIGQVVLHVEESSRRAVAGLPSAPTAFCGRDDELALLSDHLDPARAAADRPSVVAVAGLAGVGKTALVTRAARLADGSGWFPGGVLFVDLRGYQDQRVEPGAALTMLLTALGLPGADIPPDEQSRARLYLSLLAELAGQGNRLLVVLDNAADEEQVRPLLPTDGATRAIVTSRHTLAALDARQLELDVLSPPAAAELLGGVLRTARGAADARVAEEPDQLARIVALCGGLPLALRIVAALLASHPARPLSVVAADLADERSRLDELRHRDIAVRAAFDLSYRLLPPESARLFRLLPLGAGPEISTMAAAVLASRDERAARKLLDELVEAHLVEPGAADGRWALHNLVRLYADEVGQAADERSYRQKSAASLFSHYYFATINAVDLLLRSAGRQLMAEPGPLSAPVPIPSFASADAAGDWLAAEWRTVLAFATTPPPYQTSPAGLANGFATSLVPYLSIQGHFEELAGFCRVLARSARESGDQAREAHASVLLSQALRHVDRQRAQDAQRKVAAGHVFRALGERGATRAIVVAFAGSTDMTQSVDYLDEAIAAYRRAIALYRDLADPAELALTWSELGDTCQEKDRLVRANAVMDRTLHHGGQTTANVIRDEIREIGDIDNAVTAFREAAAQFARLGDRPRQVGALLDLAGALNQADRLADALAATGTAQSIAARLGPVNHARALLEHGKNLRAENRLAAAIAAFRKAGARLAKSTGDLRRHRVTCLIELYRTLDAAGQPAEAMAAAERALTLSRDIGDRASEADALLFLGWVAYDLGDLARTIACTRQAAEVYEPLGRQRELAQAHHVLGMALARQGDTADAVTHYRQALDVSAAGADFDQRREILFSLGAAYVRAGRLDDAERTAAVLGLLRRPGWAAEIRNGIEQTRQQRG